MGLSTLSPKVSHLLLTVITIPEISSIPLNTAPKVEKRKIEGEEGHARMGMSSLLPATMTSLVHSYQAR